MSYSEFFNNEFSNLDLKDARLTRRAISIGNSLIKSPGSCIQEVFSSKNEARCAYDFFSNPKVGWINMLTNHQAKTMQRIRDSPSDHIYVIQDTTFYNYTSHKAKIEIGTIGKQGRFTQFGFLQHTALCISGDDLPLGVMELDFIGYDDDLKFTAHRASSPLSEPRIFPSFSSTKCIATWWMLISAVLFPSFCLPFYILYIEIKNFDTIYESLLY